MRHALSRLALVLLLLSSVGLVGSGPGSCACVSVVSPGPDEVLLSPDARVVLAFEPPLLPGEGVQVDLEMGVDAPGGPTLRDLSPELEVDADGHGAVLQVTGLPPGRSRLQVERRPLLPFAAPGAPPLFPPALHVLDRGGFFADAEGPFAAGVQSAIVPRVLSNGAVRELEVFLWYPTDADGDPDAQLNALPAAPLAAQARALPAVFFSHGNCGTPVNTSWFHARLARAGWLVAAMTHPGNTVSDPDCNTAPEQIRSFVRRPGDVVATVDWLLALSADPQSPFFDAVDPDRLAIAGHSFGGQTAVRAVDVEPRARATLPMAPSYAPVAALLAPILPLPVPAMVQVGELDTVTPVASDAAPLYEQLTAPRFLVEILGAGHGPFTNFCAFVIPTQCPPDAHANVARFALGFLGRYAADDLRWEALIVPNPDVLLTSDP